MSFFSRPAWATEAKDSLSGTLSFQDTEVQFPKGKAYYPGENLFPSLQLDFITHAGLLIPRRRDKISTRFQSNSYWDVVLGTGQVWHEAGDGAWNRASFPLTLTDRWVGQARNCVATFVYTSDTISNVCLQCSQETADIDDQQLGNIYGMLPAQFQSRSFADAPAIVARYQQQKASPIPVAPLSQIDTRGKVADYFTRAQVTNAPTSMGALYMDGKLYRHPPQTRQGPYPYPDDMRHGLYSVTKSMAGALALMYFAERYRDDDLFNTPIAPYVPALEQVEGWQDVTFAHTLNMVTGTVGGEGPAYLFTPLIAAETAEQAIYNIARLGDAPPAPGETFNYASTNLFVLSYALQQYVQEKEGQDVHYWDLLQEHVLAPIGAEHFSVLHTLEKKGNRGLPILAYGALPTLDEAARIARLFANGGRHEGQQLLHAQRVKEVFGPPEWTGYSTGEDFRGSIYRHSFWSKDIRTSRCTIEATYMLGFGENYIVFLPSDVILFRFLDEHDLNIDRLIQHVERLRSSCADN